MKNMRTLLALLLLAGILGLSSAPVMAEEDEQVSVIDPNSNDLIYE